MQAVLIAAAVLLSLAVASVLPLLAQGAPAQVPRAPDVGGPDAVWRDKSKSPDQRARDILPRLTLQEKISLLHGDSKFSTPGLPRFGTKPFWTSDGPNGVREETNLWSSGPANHTDDFSTALPADVSLAASFDPALATAYANVIAEEALTRGKNVILGPGLNIARTPLNGRNCEYLGEDPLLTSRMCVSFINAIQSRGLAACAKHFALNNQEYNRNSVNVHVDERTLREIYLPAFKAAVTEAHVWCVMSAYNRVNGAYCSEHDFLLNEVLKKEWNFQGLVMSDWGGTHSTINAANHGLDLEMGTNMTGGSAAAHDGDFFAHPLLEVLAGGNPEVSMSRVDDMVLRDLRVMIATGLFDPPNPNFKPVPLMAPAHIVAARQIGENGIVLLKNSDSLLPIDTAKVKSIAVIGDVAQTQFAHDGVSAAIKTSYEVTPLEGIQKRASSGLSVTYAQGYARPAGANATAPATAAATAPDTLLAQAVNTAKNAELAIVVAGLYRRQDMEGADRPSFDLPPGQAELIQAVCKANPRTVVVLTGGSPSALNPWLPDCGALLMYWYGGTEGGNALARILFGDVNPSGRLPCTWPKQLTDSPAHSTGNAAEYPGIGSGVGVPPTAEAGPQEQYSEELLVGYRWFDAKNIEPQFPFGFGLSYTTFQLSDLRLNARSAPGALPADLKAPVVEVQVTVANTGSRAGAQVVQVYVQDNQSSVARPPKELKGFSKITLAPGARQTLTIPLDLSSFTFYDPSKKAWIAEAGDFTILAGDSSRNLSLKATFTLPKTLAIKEGS